ncbi:hypothetical protein KVR01_003763 [Diaporthe batatas]|uniref:uncharacterized protein n=1 Tax=Diaporthe batatas TaxID=748121 RepID=UPI001D043FF5|nr:uncharacterized protein KVR01_003763 [Diaporthe batatas]KAG8168074.1 hypothetical protein KVR01_003763 [Diaporthe batatas]
MADPAPQDLRSRLQTASDRVSELLEICRVPSISVGVLHNGEMFTRSFGSRELKNMENGQVEPLPAMSSTAYLIAQCSETLIAYAVGILVDEGKMSWDDPIRKHVPEFDVVDDKRISEGATIRQAMCHTTGLGSQDSLIQGIRGHLLVDEDGFVQLINHAPTHDKAGKDAAIDNDQNGRAKRRKLAKNQDSTADGESNDAFRDRDFRYNQYAMALVALAVQNASGQRYSEFITTRILDPLGMKDTIVKRIHMGSHRNVAVGYAKLGDDTFSEIATDALTDDAHTPVLSALGVRSSREPPNPLRQIATIWPQVDKDNVMSHGIGGRVLNFPSLGFHTHGMNQKLWSVGPDIFGFFRDNSIGYDSLISKDSVKASSVVLYKGFNNGFTSSFTICPGTKTAIVALANGLDLGDSADWASKILAQALFETKPQVDIIPLANKEAALWKESFDEILIKWHDGRSISHPESDLGDYVGKYECFNLCVDISLDPETAHLAMTINSCAGSRFDLKRYGTDAYSFMPLTRYEWLQKGMWDFQEHDTEVQNHTTILLFHRNKRGEVCRFWWRYQAKEQPGQF